jgi:hypothetical protein
VIPGKNTDKNILLVSCQFLRKKHFLDTTGWRTWCLNPGRDKIYFFCSSHPDRLWGPPITIFKWVSGFLTGGTAVGVDHSLPSRAEVKIDWSYTSTHPLRYVFMAWTGESWPLYTPWTVLCGLWINSCSMSGFCSDHRELKFSIVA